MALAQTKRASVNDSSFKLMIQDEIIREIENSSLNIIEEIGGGSYGIVWKVEYEGKIYAAKTSCQSRSNKREAQLNQEFISEVKFLARAQHKNVIQLIGVTLDRKYLVTEYMKLGSLYDLLHERPDLSYTVEHAISWIHQTAHAMRFMHDKKTHDRAIIHRDLKSLNLLLADHGRIIKICDFGTARYCDKVMTNSKGSPVWMAPEVFKGKEYDEKCDVYSFGVMFWEIIARRLPFSEFENQWELLFRKVMEGTRPPSIKGIPECINRLIEKCCESVPSERPSFEEIYEFMHNLKQFFSQETSPIFKEEKEIEEKCKETKKKESNAFQGFDDALQKFTPPENKQINTRTNYGSPIPFSTKDDHIDIPFQTSNPYQQDDLPSTSGWINPRTVVTNVQPPKTRLLNSSEKRDGAAACCPEYNQSPELLLLINSNIIPPGVDPEKFIQEQREAYKALSRDVSRIDDVEENGWVFAGRDNDVNVNYQKTTESHYQPNYLGFSMSRPGDLQRGCVD